MISETEKLAIEVEDMPFKGWSTDIGARVVAELRRLAIVEQELEALKRAISDAEPVAVIGQRKTDVRLDYFAGRVACTTPHIETTAVMLREVPNGTQLYTLKGIKP